MHPRSRVAAVVVTVLGVAATPACGSEGRGYGDDPNGSSGGDGSSGGTGGGSSGGTSGGASSGTSGGVTTPPMTGFFTVHGKDSRGTYDGEAEISAKPGGGYTFSRTAHYVGVKVEDGRDLHWAFAGEAGGSAGHVTLKTDLQRADWIVKRGTKTRAKTDTPVTISGKLDVNAKGELAGVITGTGISLDETWTYRGPGDGKPLWKSERTFLPGHAPPSSTQKSASFTLYADYHELPVIKPYTTRPEFNAAIHGNIIDKTDFAFYQANPNAIRVGQKVVDEISLAETLVRANAYRRTLAQKVAIFQAEMESKWIDPTVGTIPYGAAIGYPIFMSGDSALWTGTWVAAQAYRYEVTGDTKALAPLLVGLEALLRLQEITGDWTRFARALRKTNGTAGGVWHRGAGAFASLDWLEGGNNDMIKGLFYGYLKAHDVLCAGALAGGYTSYCNRIRTNARHLTDDVKLDVQTSDLTNSLPSSWLVAALSNDLVERATYQAKAEGLWTAGKVAIGQTPVFYDQGTVDWSGTHLSFVGDLIFMLLAQKVNLGGDAVTVIRGHIDASHRNLEKQRFAVWHLLKAAYGTSALSMPSFVDDARWKLREIPHPKLQYGDIDHRVGPEFCMSPYPSVPWKQDWMQYPEQDRTQGITTYPIFEAGVDETVWKIGNEYSAMGGVEVTSADFVHVYWFARKHGLITATE